MDNTPRNDCAIWKRLYVLDITPRRRNRRKNATLRPGKDPCRSSVLLGNGPRTRIISAFKSTSNFIIALAREFFKLFQTTPNMSNSLQEPWKLSESERIINNWLRSCETDPSTTNLFEVSSAFLRP